VTDSDLYLGVDAGNSKTLAAVADGTGRIVGWARGGLGDIYGAPTPEQAIDTVLATVESALVAAGACAAGVGAGAGRIASAAFRLAGVDWPEDEDLWTSALRERLGAVGTSSVKNDGFALLRCGDPSGVGVAVSIGTGAAMAGRGTGGEEFFVSWWFQHHLGAAGLGTDAYRATMLAELGLGEPTSLGSALSGFFGVSGPDELLHAFTRRVAPLGHHDRARSARVVVAEAAGGDPVARGIVQQHADRVVDYVSLCARRVGLDGSDRFPVVLGGSVLAAPDSYLRRLVVDALDAALPHVNIVTTGALPIRGAVLDAIAEGGVAVDDAIQAAVLASEPPEGLLTT
jgi:N-acetylglucosamine kinase-like BadF-type ATPase